MASSARAADQLAVQADAWRASRTFLLPWYASALAAMWCVALGVASTAASPGFAPLVLALVTAGVVWGYVLVRAPIADGSRALASAVPVGVVLVAMQTPAIHSVLFSADVVVDADLVLCVRVLTGLLALSFASAYRPVVLFMFVFGLSALGLVGELNVNVEAMACFLAFVYCSLFFLGYDNLLRRGRLSALTAAGGLRRVVGDQSYAAAAVFVVLALSGYAVGTVLTFGLRSPFAWPIHQLSKTVENAPELFSYAGHRPQLALGVGPIRNERTPVMTVECDRPLLWRSRVYANYTGNGWQEDPSFEGPMPEPGATAHAARGESRFEDGEEEVSYTIVPESAMSGYIPVPAVPERVSSDVAEIRISENGCAYSPQAIPPGSRITGVSRVNTTDPALLRRVERPGRVTSQAYVTAPDSARIRELAQELIRGATTLYDRVAALQRHIEATCVYNLAAPRYDGSKDAVEQFLFERREGTCAEFASALALMCRSVGIPARLAGGYNSGERRGDSGTYAIRSDHAHAWVEVNFDGVGWVTFDPVADRAAGANRLAQVAESTRRLVRGLANWARLRLVTLLFVLPSLWVLLYSSRSARRLLGRRRRRGSGDPRGAAAALYDCLCSAVGSAVGVPRHSSTASGEYWELVRAPLAGISDNVAREAHGLFEALTAHLYGPIPPNGQELRRLSARLAAVVTQLRQAAPPPPVAVRLRRALVRLWGS
ncbi:MAG TPA: transglutaminaseTgpA domain-containing protein [Armatimonadota bacterium]|nr:transglutaminaseTgpA domain-containing protein [Armatimonadota bacterium]